MKCVVVRRPQARTVAFTLFEGEKLSAHPSWRSIPQASRRVLLALAQRKKITGKYCELVRADFAGSRPEATYVLGLGKKNEYHRRRMVRAFSMLVKAAREQNVQTLAVFPEPILLQSWELEADAETLGIAAHMANYAFLSHKKAPPGGHPSIARIEFVLRDSGHTTFQRALQRAQILGEAVNAARNLANTPGGSMTPGVLVASARTLLKGLPVRVTVLGEKEMKRRGMGGILGVGSGSKEESQFLILEYLPMKKSDKAGSGSAGGKPIVFVGKGVTFDSGGLNLKPEQAILDMHHDMAGAGAVIASLAAIARLKLQRNVVGLAPLVENMPGWSGYRPGDLLRTMSGKTIEVGNTDAEGRVVLADALTFAGQYHPSFVVDVATLTGAAMVALGKRLIAGFSSNESLALAMREFSERSGDYVWPMPLWEEYSDEIRGTFGDVSNIGKVRGAGGAITAAAFLKEFVGTYEWLHFDIAPTMVAGEGQPLAPGATGTGVRLLVDIARRFEELEKYFRTE